MRQPPAPKCCDAQTWVGNGNSALAVPGGVSFKSDELVDGHFREFGVQVKRTEWPEHLRDHGEIALRRIEVQPYLIVARVEVIEGETWLEHLPREAAAEAEQVQVEAFQLGTLAEERWPITRSTRVDPAVRADRRRSSGPPHGSRFACQGRGHILRPQTIEGDVTSSSQFGPRPVAPTWNWAGSLETAPSVDPVPTSAS